MTQTDVHIHNCARCGEDTLDWTWAMTKIAALAVQRDTLLEAAQAVVEAYGPSDSTGRVSSAIAKLRQAIAQARGG